MNIKRAKELEAQGLMKPVGSRTFHRRDEKRAQLYSYEREAAKLDTGLEAKLRANKKSVSVFRDAASRVQADSDFLGNERQERETRERSLGMIIASSAKDKRIDMLSPRENDRHEMMFVIGISLAAALTNAAQKLNRH